MATAVDHLPHTSSDKTGPELHLYGLLITKDDEEIFADWCRDQLGLYDAVVCLDGSASDATRCLAAAYPDRLIYLHERDFPIPHKTDHGLRRIAHQEIVGRFGLGHWVMCCHSDEFCYHDPRAIACKAQHEGHDLVSWFSPHFYPHPDDLPEWPRLRSLPVHQRFRHYHWSYCGDGYPWLEDRLYRALPGVNWDDNTHGSVRPHGLKNQASYHPTLRHFKVVVTDPEWYEKQPAYAHYKHHWKGLEHRTGLPFPVRRFEDLFVAAIPKYARCDRFDGTFPHPWNMGEEYRCGRTADASVNESPPELHRRAGEWAVAGNHAAARRQLGELEAESTTPQFRALVRNDLAALAAADGDIESARGGFRAALAIDPACWLASANLDLLGAGARGGSERYSKAAVTIPAPCPSVRVAIVSFLFNWPSTGGGIVHTVELARFLGEAGYAVRHFHVRYEPWDIGILTESLPFDSEVLSFHEANWNVATIQERVRSAVTAFGPDYVILTDSWNFKPLLAEAVDDFPYLLRLQALECLCPLNNVRLLPEPEGKLGQCRLHQLASPQECARCIAERGRFSGSLHQAERALSGVGTPEYDKLLRRAFAGAEAVLVVNPLTEAMVSPYCRSVRVVTAGMDPSRFPWPPPQRSRQGKLRVLFAGLTEEWMKGFPVLRQACALLWTKRQDFELWATGDPVGRVDDFTRYVGWQSQAELPKLLWECDILAMPTIAQEALGRTAVEAMAAGKPVVASRLGGLPFTVADGATGLLVDPGDAVDLAEKLEFLFDDPGLRHRLGTQGRRRFEGQYAWPVIIDRHYKPLLKARRASTPAVSSDS